MNVVSSTLVIAFVSHYIAEEILYISGVITVVTCGIMLSMERTALQVIPLSHLCFIVSYFLKMCLHHQSNIEQLLWCCCLFPKMFPKIPMFR